MNARATFMLILVSSLGLDATTTAQDRGAEEPPPTEEQAPTPDQTPMGALPVEDPTINRPRTEPSDAEAAPPEDATESPTDDESQDVAEDELPTGSGLPVEDPTIHAPEEAAGEPEPTGEEPQPTPPADQPAWGQPVQVAYSSQGGFIVGVDNWFFLNLAGLVQARYSVNYRTKPPTDPTTGAREKEVTQGFDVARARFQLGIGLTEFVALYMRIGVVAGGDFSFQRAFIDLKWKYLRLRAGLFMNELIAESLINPNDHYFNDYTIVENVYSPGSSKGVMLTYLRKRFSLNLGYSDGLRTGFSEIRSPTRADFAVTLRTQYAWGERGLGGFNRLIARRGTPFGIRLGAAIHYQDGGRSQGTAPVKIALGTIDLSLRGNGWSVLLSLTAGQDGTVATAGGAGGEVLSTGGTAMGGYFVMEDLQIFGQYSIVAKPKLEGILPPNLPEISAGELSNFQTVGVGLSYFVVPNRDNVKLSTDFQYFIGYEAGSTVPSSPLNSIQPNDAGSQFAWRIQLSAAF